VKSLKARVTLFLSSVSTPEGREILKKEVEERYYLKLLKENQIKFNRAL